MQAVLLHLFVHLSGGSHRVVITLIGAIARFCGFIKLKNDAPGSSSGRSSTALSDNQKTPGSKGIVYDRSKKVHERETPKAYEMANDGRMTEPTFLEWRGREIILQMERLETSITSSTRAPKRMQHMSAAMRRTPGPSDTMKSKKGDSFVDKLTGTLTRKKKPAAHENPEVTEEDEALEIEVEGRESIDACLVPALAKNLMIDEGEVKRYLTKESSEDNKVRELISLLIYWINEELADLRIVVRNLQEDLYDGQVLQMLIEKMAGIRKSFNLCSVRERGEGEEGRRLNDDTPARRQTTPGVLQM
ncbi:unnamed protein product [Nippostrongylus brasiliensis]|uniref:Paralyzed arrest at two-fold protein 6 (inferred by orthology to a C. elegans protein) n=1 Tax=Nippostrongylus brasiliensis TaxID=27835 RepID=A0A0N4YKV8_NIPBR|nr:unnamed protein product [Nippostrongylus brasiliensis]